MSKKFLSVLSAFALVVASAASALAMTPEEEDAAWKKEPAYGKTIKIGYNGGLCTGTLGITQVKGFYEAEGIKAEIVRYQGDTVTLGNALGMHKIDVAGGPIALIEDGDIISIDIPNRSLRLEVSDDELARRKAAWKQPKPKIKTGYLARYAKLTTSASTGAVLQ